MIPALWPFVAGFIATAIVVPLLIAWQKKRALGQQVYEDGPTAHALKQGTPTLGGIAFLVAAVAGAAIDPNPGDLRLLLLACGAAAIGAADDLLILVRRRPLGLKARWKLGLLALLGIAYLSTLPSGAATLGSQRWFGNVDLALPSWLWWALSLCAIVGAANAVNLTDGLDGLAAGAIIPPLFVLGLAAFSSVAAAVLGACVAFLWFNRHPAQIFMGDTGSLLLGVLIAGAAIQSGWLLLLPLLGLLFVIEALSVVAQVISFKLTGKRIFRMSPLHHHFELAGWSEWKVTATFIASSAAATCATLAGLWFTYSDVYRSPLWR